MTNRLERLWKSENSQAAAILTVFLVLFFWTPLSRYSDVYLSSADLLQDFSLIKVEPGHVAGNALLSDSVTEMKPWRMFNRDEFAAGRFPLWNPLNGTGCPHFANYQSAVVSPFGLPYYFLSVKAALIAVAFLKLFSLGILTYLYLKQIRVSHAAALVGATAFMFAGHNVLLLTFPHVGALVVVPGGFLFIERAVQKHLQGQNYVWDLSCLTLVILAGALAGNPEPFYFGMLLAGAYSLARLAGSWFETRRTPRALRKLGLLAGSLLAAPVLASGMASFQILPFLEYLLHSRVYEQRSHEQTPLNPHFWPLEMFPDVLGNPSSPYILDYEIPPPNYELVNTAHISGFVAFLAAVALLFVVRNRYVRFFWIAGALWAVYAYDFWGLSRYFELIPTLDMAPMNRSQGDWLFCLACLGALTIDELVKRREERAPLRALALALGALAFLVVHMIGADRLILEYANVPSPNHDKFAAYVPKEIAIVVWTFGLGALLAVVLLLVRQRRWRQLAALGFLPIVFFPTGWHWRDYEPVCENRFFYPETPLLKELKQAIGGDRVAIMGEDGLPPMSNLAWRINVIPNYDGMWVRDLDALHRMFFGDTHNWRPLMKGSERALKMFGVGWVLAKWNWLPIDSAFAQRPRGGKVTMVRNEILPDRDLQQEFDCRGANLQAVSIYLSAYPQTPNHQLQFRLEEHATGKLVNEQSISFDEIRSTVFTRDHRRFQLDLPMSPTGRPVVFRFLPIPDSLGKTYRIVLKTTDGQRGESVFAWSASALAEHESAALSGGKKVAGELFFDLSFNFDHFELVKQIGEYGLYRYKDAQPIFSVVGGAVIADTDNECIGLLRAPTFDPRRMVVLSVDAQPAAAPDAPAPGGEQKKRRLVKKPDSVRVYFVLNDGTSMVWIEDEATFLANKFRWEDIETIPVEEFDKFTIVQDDPDRARKLGLRTVAPVETRGAVPTMIESSPTRYRMRIQREQPGYLVISQARYPGWVARMNDKEVPLLRANYAFNAIELPKGESEIEFSYEPQSLRYGLMISGACALIWIALLFAMRRRWKREHAAPAAA